MPHLYFLPQLLEPHLYNQVVVVLLVFSYP
jgi:hypothetical protein